MAIMKKLGIRLDAALKSKLDRTARNSGAPQAEIVRRILRKHLR